MMYMHKYLLYFLLFFGSLITFSCKKDSLKSPTASFLVVDRVSLKTTSGQGANSQKITDLWYYVDGQFKGTFPIGSVMPIVTENNATITLFAGIKNNGISATRLPYEFYKQISFNQTVEAGQTYTVSPEFEYTSNSIFNYTQDFSSTGSQFSSVGDSATVIVTSPSLTYGGTGGSLFMGMSDAKPTAKYLQTTPYFLPTGGEPIYLELDYKCNQPFIVGVIGGGSDEREALTVNSSDDWNKIYIQLTSVVSRQPTYAAQGYQVFIKATKQVNSPQIYLDNIKLIFQ